MIGTNRSSLTVKNNSKHDRIFHRSIEGNKLISDFKF